MTDLMNPGLLGHVTSAIVCAALIFNILIPSPAKFLKDLDFDFFKTLPSATWLESCVDRICGATPKLEHGADVKPTRVTLSISGEKEGDKPLTRLDTITRKIVTQVGSVDTDAVSRS